MLAPSPNPPATHSVGKEKEKNTFGVSTFRICVIFTGMEIMHEFSEDSMEEYQQYDHSEQHKSA